jgi:hypothetical protein
VGRRRTLCCQVRFYSANRVGGVTTFAEQDQPERCGTPKAGPVPLLRSVVQMQSME